MVHILIRRGSPITIVDKSFRSWNNDNRHVIEALIKAGSWWINGSTNHGGVPNTPPSPRCLKPMPALLSPPTALSKNQIVHRSIVKFPPTQIRRNAVLEKKERESQDMGLAKFVVGKTYTTCGTPDYFAPELISASGHTHLGLIKWRCCLPSWS